MILFTDDCRALDFKSTGIKPEQSLRGHVIKTVEVAKEENCQIQCFIEHRCVSFNLGQNNGRYICELSDSDQTLHPEDMIQRNGYSYHGSTVSSYTLLVCTISPSPLYASLHLTNMKKRFQFFAGE